MTQSSNNHLISWRRSASIRLKGLKKLSSLFLVSGSMSPIFSFFRDKSCTIGDSRTSFSSWVVSCSCSGKRMREWRFCLIKMKFTAFISLHSWVSQSLAYWNSWQLYLILCSILISLLTMIEFNIGCIAVLIISWVN